MALVTVLTLPIYQWSNVHWFIIKTIDAKNKSLYIGGLYLPKLFIFNMTL
jgi:hypothetical protein